MTLSNLSIVILVAAIALFVASLISRRAGTNNGTNTPTLQLVVKVLRVVILVLVASYFYIRFVG